MEVIIIESEAYKRLLEEQAKIIRKGVADADEWAGEGWIKIFFLYFFSLLSLSLMTLLNPDVFSKDVA